MLSFKDVKTDGIFELEPAVPCSSTFSIVTKNGQIKSVVGEIAVAGGEIILPSTFDTIHLRATRWHGQGDTKNSYGEHWGSGLCVNLWFYSRLLQVEAGIQRHWSFDHVPLTSVKVSPYIAQVPQKV